MGWFSNKEKDDDIVYPTGAEVWGFFHPSFKTLAGSERCGKARFEKFTIRRSEATLIDGKLDNVIYSTHFEDMRYDLTFIPLNGKYVDRDLSKLKKKVLGFAEF